MAEVAAFVATENGGSKGEFQFVVEKCFYGGFEKVIPVLQTQDKFQFRFNGIPVPGVPEAEDKHVFGGRAIDLNVLWGFYGIAVQKQGSRFLNVDIEP